MADPTPDKSGPAGKPIGGKAAAPGGPKPLSGIAKPPTAAAPKPGAPAGKPAAGKPGAKDPARDGGDFKVIRSAPIPEGGSSTPLLIGGVVIALVIGGYFVINRKSGPTPPPTTVTDTSSTEAEITGPETMPDGIWDIFMERQSFLVGEGRLTEALKEALEKEKEYATSRKLRNWIADLRSKTAGGPAATPTVDAPEALLSQAETALQRSNATEALAKLDELLSRDGLPDALAGKAHFLRAVTSLSTGDALAASNDVEAAAGLNFDPKKCDELREQIAASQQPR